MSYELQNLNIDFGIYLTGVEEAQNNIRKFVSKLNRAVGGAIYDVAGLIMDDSQNLVPVDTHELRDSAYISRVAGPFKRKHVEAGYGAEHAIPVHERFDQRHSHGEDHFLLTAIGLWSRQSSQVFGENVIRRLESGSPDTLNKRYPLTPPAGR